MAQSKPRIHDNHARRHFSQKRPDVSVGTANGWDVTAFTQLRTIYRGTRKQYSIVRVQKDYRQSLTEKKGNTKGWDFWRKPRKPASSPGFSTLRFAAG